MKHGFRGYLGHAVVLAAKPWTSAQRKWSLAQNPHDEWGEVFCTHNEEPDEIKKIDAAKPN